MVSLCSIYTDRFTTTTSQRCSMEHSTVYATFKRCMKPDELIIQRSPREDSHEMIIFFFKCFSRHLGRNPFLCDCYLTWLADYLHRKPVETSGVRCESPRRMQRRRISVLRDEKSRCSGKFKCKAPLFQHYATN